MGKTRQIKYETFLNSKLGQLPPENRLLFIGLWCIADREGRLKDDPAKIKAQLFPYDNNLDINSMLDSLTDEDDPFIIRYSVDGKCYIQIEHFTEHQHCHRNESKTKLPDKNGNYPDGREAKTLNGQTIDIPKTNQEQTIDASRPHTTTYTSTLNSTTTYKQDDDVDSSNIQPSEELIEEALSGIQGLGMQERKARDALDLYGSYNFVTAYFAMLNKYNDDKVDNPVGYFLGVLRNGG